MFDWLFHRKSTGNPRVTHTPKATLDIVTQLTDDLASVRQRVHRLEMSYKELQEAHDTLEKHVHKLRGQVHGVAGGRPRLVRAASDIPTGDKEALREYVGLRAGIRPNVEE